MSINEVRYLPECGSTNAYVKEHFEEFGPVGAVYTENQTAGRGRLGRSWVNAEGKALYYTVAIREPLAQPATLPLLASLAVRRQLQLRYGVDCQIKWPNDLLLNGKKVVGILCESVSYGYQQRLSQIREYCYFCIRFYHLKYTRIHPRFLQELFLHL